MSSEDFLPEMIRILELVLKGLVDNPDEIKVKTYQGERTIVFSVRPDRADLGKVIGKKGQNADAIRTILIAVASKHKVRAILEIEE